MEPKERFKVRNSDGDIEVRAFPVGGANIDPDDPLRPSHRVAQTGAFRTHKGGTRKAHCPLCGQVEKVRHGGDSLGWFCKHCLEDVAAPVLPYGKDEKALWADVGISAVNFKNIHFDVWTDVLSRAGLNADACPHRRATFERYKGTDYFKCSDCGTRYDPLWKGDNYSLRQLEKEIAKVYEDRNLLEGGRSLWELGEEICYIALGRGWSFKQVHKALSFLIRPDRYAGIYNAKASLALVPIWMEDPMGGDIAFLGALEVEFPANLVQHNSKAGRSNKPQKMRLFTSAYTHQHERVHLPKHYVDLEMLKNKNKQAIVRRYVHSSDKVWDA